MAKDLQKFLDAFQGNAYPAMIEDLALHLGVSADSIRRLALGWAPIVPFKKRTSYTGWWAIPERDDSADLVGLGLRSQNDLKVMFPGSSHGLIYEVNPDHVAGEKGYSGGAHNWTRTMDAGTPCPVCGRPDGCLLSAENPADPKAIICIRVQEGAVRPMRFGWLHLRRHEGHLNGTSALADNGGPVVVVEGFSDTAAAMDLGFTAVGRPSNLAGLSALRDLLRSRKVILVGENDKKADGREPGREGMMAAFAILRKVCPEITMVMPPLHVKDLRAWKSKYGLTREIFETYVASSGEQHAEDTLLSDDRPLTITRAFLGSNYKLGKRYSLRRWNEEWYYFDKVKYAPLSEEEFRQPLYQWSHNKYFTLATEKGETVKPLVANKTLATNVSEAAAAETLVPRMEVPCWINNGTGPDPKNLIVFTNGLLDVESFLRGDPESEYLRDPTPDYFTLTAIPFAFDQTAKCPTWQRFLASTIGDDSDKIKLLREWFGYCLTPDTSLQKLMYLRGPAGAGKGTIMNVLTQMVGPGQSASPAFADMTGEYSNADLVGKLVCVIPDARTPKHADTMRGLERLLSIASGDPVRINQKYVAATPTHRLITKITIGSNEFLDVQDHAGAMLRRLNVIEFTRSFQAKPDTKMESKLIAELPGIAVWALEGLRHLRAQGAFTVPASSLRSLQEWRLSTSPLAAFIEDACDEVSGGEVLKTELYDAWAAWSDERKLTPISVSRFYERMKANAPYAISDTYEQNGHKFSVFRGIQLKDWAERKLLRRT